MFNNIPSLQYPAQNSNNIIQTTPAVSANNKLVVVQNYGTGVFHTGLPQVILPVLSSSQNVPVINKAAYTVLNQNNCPRTDIVGTSFLNPSLLVTSSVVSSQPTLPITALSAPVNIGQIKRSTTPNQVKPSNIQSRTITKLSANVNAIKPDLSVVAKDVYETVSKSKRTVDKFTAPTLSTEEKIFVLSARVMENQLKNTKKESPKDSPSKQNLPSKPPPLIRIKNPLEISEPSKSPGSTQAPMRTKEPSKQNLIPNPVAILSKPSTSPSNSDNKKSEPTKIKELTKEPAEALKCDNKEREREKVNVRTKLPETDIHNNRPAKNPTNSQAETESLLKSLLTETPERHLEIKDVKPNAAMPVVPVKLQSVPDLNVFIEIEDENDNDSTNMEGPVDKEHGNEAETTDQSIVILSDDSNEAISFGEKTIESDINPAKNKAAPEPSASNIDVPRSVTSKQKNADSPENVSGDNDIFKSNERIDKPLVTPQVPMCFLLQQVATEAGHDTDQQNVADDVQKTNKNDSYFSKKLHVSPTLWSQEAIEDLARTVTKFYGISKGIDWEYVENQMLYKGHRIQLEDMKKQWEHLEREAQYVQEKKQGYFSILNMIADSRILSNQNRNKDCEDVPKEKKIKKVKVVSPKKKSLKLNLTNLIKQRALEEQEKEEDVVKLLTPEQKIRYYREKIKELQKETSKDKPKAKRGRPKKNFDPKPPKKLKTEQVIKKEHDIEVQDPVSTEYVGLSEAIKSVPEKIVSPKPEIKKEEPVAFRTIEPAEEDSEVICILSDEDSTFSDTTEVYSMEDDEYVSAADLKEMYNVDVKVKEQIESDSSDDSFDEMAAEVSSD